MIAFTTHTKSESCEEHSRICSSCSKKGLFNVQERHVLEWRRASFCSKLGLSMKREEHDNWNILTVPIEMVSVLLIQRVRSISHEGAFFFSQKNRTHKGSQRHQVNRYHRTLQLILVERPLWILYAGGLLWVRNVGGKVLLNLWVLWEKNSPASFANVLFLTDNTDEQNTQHSTETSSQPISQNLTANVS